MMRWALEQAYLPGSRAVEILVEQAQKRMAALQACLFEYIRKHGWDARAEEITLEEHDSWREAIAFFSGGLMQDIPREESDPNRKPALK